MLFDLFNLVGLAIVTIMMIPNIIFAKKHPEGFVNYWHNKPVEILEQIGRYGSFGFMFVCIPGVYFGFPSGNWLAVYLIGNASLLIAYLVIWIILFNKKSLFKTLCLAIFPSLIFILSGICSRSILLILTSIIFAPCHILISVKNLFGEQKVESVKNK